MVDIWQEILSKSSIAEVPENLLERVRASALNSADAANISFGTAGWRAVIGDDYTVFNLRRVTRAVIEMYRQDADALKQSLGVGSWQEFRQRGGLIGHDTRFMAEEFSRVVGCMLNDEGVRTAYAGTATTPELSACVRELSFACSINLTPSHNPGDYGGSDLWRWPFSAFLTVYAITRCEMFQMCHKFFIFKRAFSPV